MFGRYLRVKAVDNPALKALLVADGLILTAAAMLAPIYAIYVERIGGDLLSAGLTIAALAFGSGVTSLFSGKIIDKIENKGHVIAVGFLAVGIGFMLYTVVGSMWGLALVQVFIGLSRAMYDPAFDALYSNHLDKHHEAEEWGAWEALSYFTAGTGAILGGVIVTYGSFNMLFVVMASMCFLSSLYVFALPKRLL